MNKEKKMIKRILTILLVAAMLLSAALLVSCDSNTNDTTTGTTPTSESQNTYTLTILDNNGDPVQGAGVLFYNGSYKQATTDAEGKAVVEMDGGDVLVSITKLPTGCTKPQATVEGSYHGRFEAGKKELTLTVERTASKTVTYTVNVVDQNGTAVENVYVQVCHGNICESAKATDASGKMTIDLAENLALDVKIYTLPDGYTAPDPIDANGYHAHMDAGTTEITVTITKNS